MKMTVKLKRIQHGKHREHMNMNMLENVSGRVNFNTKFKKLYDMLTIEETEQNMEENETAETKVERHWVKIKAAFHQATTDTVTKNQNEIRRTG
jgi:hypothetical protein